MKKLLRSVVLALTLALAACTADSGFKPIFNGKDLSGWEGLPQFWSVKDGALTGQTKAQEDLKANTFLVYKDAQPANFELRLQFRITGQNPEGRANSGVQYRSRILDAATFAVGGYQADLDIPFRYTGMLYDEKSRGILMNAGEKIIIGETTLAPDTKKKDGKRKQTAVEKLPGATPATAIAAAYKLGEWNDLVIVARGSHLRHTVNGVVTAEATETDAAIAKSGVIALQLHVGPPMTVQFKNLQLKVLP